MYDKSCLGNDSYPIYLEYQDLKSDMLRLLPCCSDKIALLKYNAILLEKQVSSIEDIVKYRSEIRSC